MFIAQQSNREIQQNQTLPVICKVNQLSLFRRQAWLLYRLSFAVAPGECWLLTGQNGSGKTTLLRIMAGLCIPDEGGITYNPKSDPSLLYLASPSAKIPELTVIENLRFQALLRWGKHPTPSILNEALDYWGIDHLATQAVANLSQGQQQRAALALLLLGPASLWLLDEPSTALDAAGIDALWVLCRQHQAAGGSIMMATHQEPKGNTPGLRRIQLGVRSGGGKR